MVKFNENAMLKREIHVNNDLRKKAKDGFGCFDFLEKLWKVLESIEILNLPQQKEEGVI